MGVNGLIKVIKSEAPAAVREVSMTDLSGKTIAIDASISVYQFLGVKTTGGKPIVNKRGEPINHLQGFFFRTIQMLENRITPLYVFDGAPPDAKEHVLEKRRATRTVHLQQTYFDDIRTMLRHMGVDTIDARGEAEATCAVLAQKGKFDVTAVGSDDVDSLAFGAPFMIKKLAVGGPKSQMRMIALEGVLAGLQLNQKQLIDYVILCGCDYTGTLPGIGPKRALALMRKHGDIETILKAEKIEQLDDFDYKTARREFSKPKVTQSITVRGRYRHDDLRDFLISKGLDVSRVNGGLERLKTIRVAK